MDDITLVNVRNLLHIPKHNELTIDNVRYDHSQGASLPYRKRVLGRLLLK